MTHSNSSIINRCDKEKHFAGKQILVLAFQMIIIKTNKYDFLEILKDILYPLKLFIVLTHIFKSHNRCLENVNPLVYRLYFVLAIGNLVFLYSNCCMLEK